MGTARFNVSCDYITVIIRPVRVYVVRILWCPQKIPYRLATAGEQRNLS